MREVERTRGLEIVQLLGVAKSQPSKAFDCLSHREVLAQDKTGEPVELWRLSFCATLSRACQLNLHEEPPSTRLLRPMR